MLRLLIAIINVLANLPALITKIQTWLLTRKLQSTTQKLENTKVKLRNAEVKYLESETKAAAKKAATELKVLEIIEHFRGGPSNS